MSFIGRLLDRICYDETIEFDGKNSIMVWECKGDGQKLGGGNSLRDFLKTSAGQYSCLALQFGQVGPLHFVWDAGKVAWVNKGFLGVFERGYPIDLGETK